jgi:heme oxygenase
MNLKEQTAEKHKEAESQPFIKSIFDANVNKEDYADYLFQLANVYHMLEEVVGKKFNLFEGMEELKRTKAITIDFNEIKEHDRPYMIRESTLAYLNYLLEIEDPQDAMAHVYVRHMGDLFGGQMLAKLVPGSGTMYQFDNVKKLVTEIRSKLNDDMGPEANIAFDHNIAMIKEYS